MPGRPNEESTPFTSSICPARFLLLSLVLTSLACTSGIRDYSLDDNSPPALLVVDGRLATQKISADLPPPELLFLPHSVTKAFDANEKGSILYGVLNNGSMELWILGTEPSRLASNVLRAAFIDADIVAYLNEANELFRVGDNQPIAKDVASFGRGGSSSILITRDDRSPTGPGVWRIDSEGREDRLSEKGLTGIWSARYSPVEHPSGEGVVFLSGDAHGVSVLMVDTSTGRHTTLVPSVLPPIESMAFIGKNALLLSGLGVHGEMDSPLLFVDLEEERYKIRPLGEGRFVGSIGDQALFFAQSADAEKGMIERVLTNPRELERLSPLIMNTIRIQQKPIHPEQEKQFKSPGTLTQSLDFYEVKYSRPMEGGTLTSFFSHGDGKRFDCQCNGASCRSGHRGTDFADPRGTPLFASAEGKVSMVVTGCPEGNHSCGGGYGNYVKIVHSNGHSSYYAHMQRVDKTEGGARCHEQIGTVGNTGRSYGAHVHFEIRSSNDTRLDPFLGECNNTVEQSLWIEHRGANPAFVCSSDPVEDEEEILCEDSKECPSGKICLEGVCEDDLTVPGFLLGVVFEAPDTNRRISGARVYLSNGETAISNDNGTFSFEVQPGVYRVSATKDGYAQRTLARKVDPGKRTWGSVGLSKLGSATGDLVGYVYEYPNPDKRIPGAFVQTGCGLSAYTDQEGVYRIQDVPAGEMDILVSAEGYREASLQRLIGAGSETWGSIGLSR